MSLPSPSNLDNPGETRLSEEVFTIGHLTDSFLAHVRILVRAGVNEPATEEWYANQFKHLAPLRHSPADTLRTHHLASIDLTNAFTRAIKRLYKWAAAEDLVPKDPFAKLAIPPCGARTRILTRPELRRLYLASSRELRRLLFVQIRTIARPGEIRDLTWGQIHWTRRVIVLEEFKCKKKRRDKLRARNIPLPVQVQRLLQNMHRKATNTAPDSPVFRSPRYGKPWTANGVRCAMRVARAKAGLDAAGGEKVVCYTCRHTGATNAIRAEMSLKMLAEIMGHARTTTTERYCHLDTTDLVDAIDRAAATQRTRHVA